VLHTLYYPDELHKASRSEPPKTKYSARELELARSLVSHLKAPFKPQEFRDEYRNNVERLIEQKRKGQKVTQIEQPRKAPVIDLIDALRRSLKSSSGPSKESGTSGKSRKKAPGHRKAA
jgi:DNA end-binding protein Ku